MVSLSMEIITSVSREQALAGSWLTGTLFQFELNGSIYSAYTKRDGKTGLRRKR